MSKKSGFRWGRMLVAVLATEVSAILVLVALIAIRGMIVGDVETEHFAERAGFWVGPIAGSLATAFFAWWAGRVVPGTAAKQGLVIGVLVAALDFGILLAAGAPMQLVFFVSNGLKCVAGAVGGAVAARSDSIRTAPD